MKADIVRMCEDLETAHRTDLRGSLLAPATAQSLQIHQHKSFNSELSSSTYEVFLHALDLADVPRKLQPSSAVLLTYRSCNRPIVWQTMVSAE